MGHSPLPKDWSQNYLMHALLRSYEHSIARHGGTWMLIGSHIQTYQFLTVTHSGCSSRKGLNAKQAEYAVKKYRSHRRVGAGIMMDMGILNNPE
jgi:hypothetical protein